MAIIIDPEYQKALETGEELAEWARSRDDAARQREVDIDFELHRDLSSAIAGVLAAYGAGGRFYFSVIKTDGPIEYLKGERIYPRSCYAAHSGVVDDPEGVKR